LALEGSPLEDLRPIKALGDLKIPLTWPYPNWNGYWGPGLEGPYLGGEEFG